MKLHRNKSNGFSIVEILLATVLVISLSAVSYRVLKTLTLKQAVNVTGQKSNKAAQIAIDRFKNDMSMVDYNWVKYGVASIYPHPGYGFDFNYYVDTNIRNKERLNDGITFLRRNPSNDKIYDLGNLHRLCYPQAETSKDGDLYSNTLIMSTTDGLQADEWVLIYQAGKYAIGMIQRVNSNGIILIPPLSTTEQQIALNGNSQMSGFVGRAGVVPSNMDFHTNLTNTTADNSFCFDINAARIQKIANPVSYFVDYRTTDGEEKSANNSFVLDKSENPQKMLVRVEYKKGGFIREYIAAVDQVEFSYDLLTDDTAVSGGVIRNVGHDSDVQMLKLLANTDPDGTDLEFESTSKIVAVKMNLELANEGSDKADKDWKQTQEIKVAIDPSLKEGMYQDAMKVDSFLTNKLETLTFVQIGDPKIYTTTESLGKPLYLSTGAGQEIIVPVTRFEIDENGNMGPDSNGQLYVYDALTDPGCAVNPTRGCTPSDRSSIRFTLDTGQTFFPNTVNQTLLADGTTRIFVGGVGMSVEAGVPSRTPMMATIDVAPGETLKDKLYQSIPTTTSCNIGNCSVQIIDNKQTGLEDFVDTANITVDRTTGNLYVATMTKKIGSGSPSMIYKGIWNGTDYSYAPFSDVPDSDQGRVVSAVADRLVEVGGDKYLAVCLTKKLDSSCAGECLDDTNGAIPGITDPNNDAFGRIELIKNATERIVLMRNNYQCSSMSVDNNNNLLISGRLSLQAITTEEIRNALTDSSYLANLQKKVLYLDEVGGISNGKAVYADYFQIDPSTYETESVGPQDIGWLTGTSAVEFSDGTFGIVNANKYRLEPGAESGGIRNSSTSTEEYSNVGIQKVSLAGMQDRVVATIQTNQANVNNSIVTATYNVAITEIPDMYFPGTFKSNTSSGTPRTTPTPLPAASPAMSDQSWIDLYRHIRAPTGQRTFSGLNESMPTIGNSMQEFDCRNSYPKSCSN